MGLVLPGEGRKAPLEIGPENRSRQRKQQGQRPQGGNVCGVFGKWPKSVWLEGAVSDREGVGDKG